MSEITEITETAVLVVPIDRVWDIVSDTSRYAEWVHGVLEVREHHGTAEIGKTYSERNRTIGPLTTRSTWTVQQLDKPTLRVDTGTGFDPMHDMTNTFTFRPVSIPGDGDNAAAGTEMTYTVRFRPGLGPIGRLIDRLQQPGLRKAFRTSMHNLETLVISEGT